MSSPIVHKLDISQAVKEIIAKNPSIMDILDVRTTMIFASRYRPLQHFDTAREAHEEAIQHLRESQEWAMAWAMRLFHDTIVVRVRKNWRSLDGDGNDEDDEYDYVTNKDTVKAESVDHQPEYRSYREDVLCELGFDEDLRRVELQGRRGAGDE